MGRIFNRVSENEKRRQLRCEMTKAETFLWLHLKGKQMHGCKFRRQYSVNSYVLDFYCPEIKLAIEVDGFTHLAEEEIEYDNKRQREIGELGIQFLRFWNYEVYDDLYNVIERIKNTVKELMIKTTPT